MLRVKNVLVNLLNDGERAPEAELGQGAAAAEAKHRKRRALKPRGEKPESWWFKFHERFRVVSARRSCRGCSGLALGTRISTVVLPVISAAVRLRSWFPA